MSALLGHVSELVRYPVKSMAGVPAASMFLGWHGLGGDRRYAFRRLTDSGGFPWLTASRVPELVLYQPVGLDEAAEEPRPGHIRTPAGELLAPESERLRREIVSRFGAGVELMQLNHGIFDDAALSIITLATLAGIGRTLGAELDRRRFRANVVLDTTAAAPFAEDGWVGATLEFGASGTGPAVCITALDARCRMVNFDPDTAAEDPGVLKAVMALNRNNAGVYATVNRTGWIRAGDPVWLAAKSRSS
jgi:uncharacterized protein